MQVKTILNRVQKFKSFVYTTVRWVWSDEAPVLEVEVAERANGRPRCSGCRRPRAGYDRLPRRRFEFVPLWGINKITGVRDHWGQVLFRALNSGKEDHWGHPLAQPCQRSLGSTIEIAW